MLCAVYLNEVRLFVLFVQSTSPAHHPSWPLPLLLLLLLLAFLCLFPAAAWYMTVPSVSPNVSTRSTPTLAMNPAR